MRRRRSRRIAAVEPLGAEAIAPAPAKRAEPRVPFLSVVEGGLVSPGRGARRRAPPPQGAVRADGTLALGPAIGSIHKIGALAQGLPACNGWTFWHAERSGALVAIDAFRATVRAAMATA